MLRAGVAVGDITPAVGYPLEGYGRDRPSVGVLDPLEVAVLALENGGDPFLLIAVDHVGLLVGETDVVRAAIAAACGVPVDHLMVCFSHTHSGPLADNAYVELLAQRAGEVAVVAVGRLAPAVAGWATTSAAAAVNRRAVGADDRAVMAASPDGPVDDRVGVLRVIDHDGEPLAVVVRYSAHANVLRADNLFVSADWPGALRRAVEPHLRCPVLVLNGSAGDINPRWRGSVDDLKAMVDALLPAVLDAVGGAAADDDTSVAVRSQTFDLELQELPEPTEADRVGAEAESEWDINPAAWLREVGARRDRGERSIALPIEVQVARVGNGIVAGIPMETFTRLALAFAADAPGIPAFFNGYTNGWVGYLPATDDLPHGGYEVDWAPVSHGVATGWLTPAKPGTAEAVVRAAAESARGLESARRD